MQHMNKIFYLSIVSIADDLYMDVLRLSDILFYYSILLYFVQ